MIDATHRYVTADKSRVWIYGLGGATSVFLATLGSRWLPLHYATAIAFTVTFFVADLLVKRKHLTGRVVLRSLAAAIAGGAVGGTLAYFAPWI